MPHLIYQPLRAGEFPRPFSQHRRDSPFRSSWLATEDLLYAELRALGTHEAVIAVEGLTDGDIRRDGGIRANARAGAAVLVAFDSPGKGSLMFPADRFRTWQDNVRAVALGLEALRKVDRYGITSHAEQYRGWQALPPGTPMPAARMTVDEAERFLLSFNEPGEVLVGAPRDLWRRLYHNGARRLHPDKGGDPEEFRRLREAYDLVGGLTANRG